MWKINGSKTWTISCLNIVLDKRLLMTEKTKMRTLKYDAIFVSTRLILRSILNSTETVWGEIPSGKIEITASWFYLLPLTDIADLLIGSVFNIFWPYVHADETLTLIDCTIPLISIILLTKYSPIRYSFKYYDSSMD